MNVWMLKFQDAADQVAEELLLSMHQAKLELDPCHWNSGEA